MLTLKHLSMHVNMFTSLTYRLKVQAACMSDVVRARSVDTTSIVTRLLLRG